MQETLYRRPLPGDTIAFASDEGRKVFAEALASGGLAGYFALAEQFHTQSDPAFCGLGSLVVALNGLGVDPGRLWKGPWRWFAEDLLDCCVPLDRVRERGLSLDEVACLARCNGVEVTLERADATDFASFEAALRCAARGETVMIAAYDRATLGQTGGGHFSPVGGFHAARALVLILDVARFKYPPHWVGAQSLWRAMQPHDPDTGRARGWLTLRRRAHASGFGFTMRYGVDEAAGLAQQLGAVTAAIDASTEVAGIAASLAPLAAYVDVRQADEPAHQQAIERARAALREVPAYSEVERAVGPERAEAVMILMLAVSDRLPSAKRKAWLTSPSNAATDTLLDDELTHLRAQVSALWKHADVCCAR